MVTGKVDIDAGTGYWEPGWAQPNGRGTGQDNRSLAVASVPCRSEGFLVLLVCERQGLSCVAQVSLKA